MYRTKDWGGMALAHCVSLLAQLYDLTTIQTLLLILYGAYCANKFTIFYWYYQPDLRLQFVQGVPLNGWGFWYFITFNGLCVFAIVAHQRASHGDPGIIPPGMVAPGETEYFENKNCEKCTNKQTWKPIRAHHCRECGYCIFKVSY